MPIFGHFKAPAYNTRGFFGRERDINLSRLCWQFTSYRMDSQLCPFSHRYFLWNQNLAAFFKSVKEVEMNERYLKSAVQIHKTQKYWFSPLFVDNIFGLFSVFFGHFLYIWTFSFAIVFNSNRYTNQCFVFWVFLEKKRNSLSCTFS